MGGKKQLTTLDIAAEVAYLRKKIMNMNIINIFDVNPKVIKNFYYTLKKV